MPCDQARLVQRHGRWRCLRTGGEFKALPERAQIGYRVPQQLHPRVPVLHACKAEQQALARIFPSQGPLDVHAYRVDSDVEPCLWGGPEQREARAQSSSPQTRTSRTGRFGGIHCSAHRAAGYRTPNSSSPAGAERVGAQRPLTRQPGSIWSFCNPSRIIMWCLSISAGPSAWWEKTRRRSRTGGPL